LKLISRSLVQVVGINIFTHVLIFKLVSMSKHYYRHFGILTSFALLAFMSATAQDFFPLTPEIQHLTELGTTGPDLGNGVALDREGNTYFAGRFASATVPNFVASNSFGGGASDGFLTRLTRQGNPVKA
jgi:hypothetical protein